MMWLIEGGWLVAKFVADVLGCHCAVLESLKLDWEAGKSRLRNRGRGLDVSVWLACEALGTARCMVWEWELQIEGEGLGGAGV
jgi:hypothetical protein